MNDSIYWRDPPNENYTSNRPTHQHDYPSTLKPHTNNTHLRHSYSPAAYEDTHSQPERTQFNTLNLQRQRQRQQSSLGTQKCQSIRSSSPTSYYNHIHAQVHSNTPATSYQNLSCPSPAFEREREMSPVRTNNDTQHNCLDVPANQSTGISPRLQHRSPDPTSVVYRSSSNLSENDEDPSLDFPHYTIDSLIQQLVPTDTRLPKRTFLYQMLMCSRMHIRPSLFLNKLARLTIQSISYSTRDQSVRVLNNFLHILTQWTRTFPYDFRNTEMMSELIEILKKLNSYEPTLQYETNHINKKLHSKLMALETYEEYIQQLNRKASNSLTELALFTDITNECPTSLLFAQQLTHIELDRLKPIGAEELLQYFIMKLAFEEERAHPSRTHQSATTATTASKSKSLSLVHDHKLTFCLETYVQWFNRLTFFVTTEIVKHTQRRLRMRLINYFIEAAYECFRLHNFNSMIGIIGGLNMQPVKRLKRTWEKIQLDKLQQLEQYTSVSKNFSNYRLVLKAAMAEAIKHDWAIDNLVVPFTSIILQDVYFIKTHSKDYTAEGGINLKKYYSMAKFISEEFVQCKQSKCSFKRNDVIINYIITSPTFDEDSLMLASFECEPAVTPNEKEKLTMLQASVNKSSWKF